MLYCFVIKSAELVSILLTKHALLNYTQLTVSTLQPLFNLFIVTLCVSVVGEGEAGMWGSESVDV